MAAVIFFGVIKIVLGIAFVIFSIIAIRGDLGNLSFHAFILTTILTLIRLLFNKVFHTEPYQPICMYGMFYLIIFASFLIPYFSFLFCGVVMIEGISLITSVIPSLHDLIFTHRIVYVSLFLLTCGIYLIKHFGTSSGR